MRGVVRQACGSRADAPDGWREEWRREHIIQCGIPQWATISAFLDRIETRAVPRRRSRSTPRLPRFFTRPTFAHMPSAARRTGRTTSRRTAATRTAAAITVDEEESPQDNVSRAYLDL